MSNTKRYNRNYPMEQPIRKCHFCDEVGYHDEMSCPLFLKAAKEQDYPKERPIYKCHICDEVGYHDDMSCPLFLKAVKAQKRYTRNYERKHPEESQAGPSQATGSMSSNNKVKSGQAPRSNSYYKGGRM